MKLSKITLLSILHIACICIISVSTRSPIKGILITLAIDLGIFLIWKIGPVLWYVFFKILYIVYLCILLVICCIVYIITFGGTIVGSKRQGDDING